ncbi:hypothetical protein COCNU_13G007060 [Cocos nucifera]|uniref:Uncharacterized protein n=1 Tax=Cocos nucifera TaxID=13894 RepID=A0A8K0NB21_COCNU|nr:hypothetical protein COCNU_13G007060 [Cocos nucifera]
MQSDKDLELLLERGLPLGVHELRDLVDDVEKADGIKGIGKSIVGGKGVAEVLLVASPMKEVDEDGEVE